MYHFRLIEKMLAYYAGDPKRIQHFLKVYEFAKIIGIKEAIPQEQQHLLELAAIIHDIGIKKAEEKYGRCDGKLQEQEGPAEVERMLRELEYSQEIIDRVSYLVAHHHTYTDIDGADYQILVEADFLVNMYEEHMSRETIESTYERIFKTESGRKVCREVFGL